MLCRGIIAVCSHIHTKLLNMLFWQNVELLNVKPGGTYSDHLVVDCWRLVMLPPGRPCSHCNSQLHHRIPSAPVSFRQVCSTVLCEPRSPTWHQRHVATVFGQPQPPVPKITFRRRGCVDQRRHTWSDVTKQNTCPVILPCVRSLCLTQW